MFKGPQCESVALCYGKIYLKIYQLERSRKRRTRKERERERERENNSRLKRRVFKEEG